MGSRRIRNRFQFVDFENPEIRFPAMKVEKRIIVGAEVARDSLSGDSVIEHSAQRYPIYRTCLDAETDDAPGELIHHHEDPMRPQCD